MIAFIFTSLSAVQIYDFHIFTAVLTILFSKIGDINLNHSRRMAEEPDFKWVFSERFAVFYFS